MSAKKIKDTPYLIIDRKKLENRCKEYNNYFGIGNVYYSVKANNDKSVLKVIASQEINFDVASKQEIEWLKDIGVSMDRIFFSAPTKIPRDIEYAYQNGVSVYAADSSMEIEKISKLAPKSKVFIRLSVDNAGSEWPLVKKFGATTYEAYRLLQTAKRNNLIPYGLAFHVGSQNISPETWKRALEKVKEVDDLLVKSKIQIELIDIGGGVPVKYRKDVPLLDEISNVIHTKFEELGFDGKRLVIEPGRSLVGESGVLVASVISRAKRGEDEWLYLDIGAYNGLQETLEGFEYTILTEKKSKKLIPYTLCGPSCDSTDKYMQGVLLPHNLTLGDKLYFQNAGAYTNSYDSYNGLLYPELVVKG